MNVPHQFEEIGFFFAEDRFVPVLKKMAVSPMASVERDGIACEKPTHQMGHRAATRAKEKMDVIGEKRPGVTGGMTFGEYRSQAIEKSVSIDIIIKNASALDPANNDMVKSARYIKSCFSRHV